MFAYLIVPSGPRLVKLRVLKAWMPASWSPSNGVTVFEQPAFAAPREAANHTRIVLGPRALAKGCVELVTRAGGETREVPIGEVVGELRKRILQ